MMQCMRGITELAYVYSCLKLGKDQTVWNNLLLHKYTNTILALTSFATCEERVEHPTA